MRSSVVRDIWVISDLHYGHAGILEFVDYQGQKVRPEFANVDEMNECLLEMHNSVVKPGDIYINLGDVFFGDKANFEKNFPKFHGRKRLLLGNHDDGIYLAKTGFFQKIGLWRMFPELGILMSHVPLHEMSLYRGKDLTRPMTNIHGHIHRLDSAPGPYRNVCVEKTNYTPIHIEELRRPD
jgi:calcineurin-like phosphoesterase family protein